MAEKSIHDALGATHPEGGEQITLFLPSKDRNGIDINQEKWRDKALDCFGRLFRGATAFPPGKGVWRDDENDGRLIHDETIMIVTYISEKVLWEQMGELRKFLHKLGRETNQGEVGIIINDSYHGISVYDKNEV